MCKFAPEEFSRRVVFVSSTAGHRGVSGLSFSVLGRVERGEMTEQGNGPSLGCQEIDRILSNVSRQQSAGSSAFRYRNSCDPIKVSGDCFVAVNIVKFEVAVFIGETQDNRYLNVPHVGMDMNGYF